MKEQILKLRAEGKTYNEIQKELNCSKGTIAYHCGVGQKEKTFKAVKKRRAINGGIYSKLESFRDPSSNRKSKRLQRFSKNTKILFTWKDVIDKFGENTVCYLSGNKINLFEDKYHFDHIIPSSRGGSNNIDNLGILTPIVNQMKHNLLNNELIDWCKKILEYQGYKILK